MNGIPPHMLLTYVLKYYKIIMCMHVLSTWFVYWHGFTWEILKQDHKILTKIPPKNSKFGSPRLLGLPIKTSPSETCNFFLSSLQYWQIQTLNNPILLYLFFIVCIYKITFETFCSPKLELWIAIFYQRFNPYMLRSNILVYQMLVFKNPKQTCCIFHWWKKTFKHNCIWVKQHDDHCMTTSQYYHPMKHLLFWKLNILQQHSMKIQEKIFV
jgi:hypothetical protein